VRRPKRRKANEFQFEPNWLRLEALRAIGPGVVTEHRGKPEYQIPVATFPEADLPDEVCCLAGLYRRDGFAKVKYRDRRFEPMPTKLLVHRQVWECLTCGAKLREDVPDLDENWFVTKRFKREVQLASVKRPFSDAAALFGVDDSYIIRMFDEYAQERFDNYQMDLPRVFGVDENRILGGDRFICANVETGQILDLLPSRDFKAISRMIGEAAYKMNVEVFVQDMWSGYRTIAQTFFPKALNVVDKFHVVRYANDAFADARKFYQTKLDKGEGKSLKNRHKLFLARWDNLAEKRQDVLAEILDEHPFLYNAYVAKERFYMMYDLTDRDEAMRYYKDWAEETPKDVRRFFSTVRRFMKNWEHEIFNYFSARYTNGMVENLNGRINLINQMAKGMTFERFRRKAILRYGTLIPLSELAVFSGEPDHTDIGHGFELSLFERDLRRGKF
jgi:transposase